ncbi:MAG: hypothetical protein Q9Q40_14985 [Acidobacteriota bacterium]|nr:hypothetical protein [Acidobacteriota bacterium]
MMGYIWRMTAGIHLVPEFTGGEVPGPAVEIRYLGENPPLRQLEAGKWTRGFATLGCICFKLPGLILARFSMSIDSHLSAEAAACSTFSPA